MSKCHQCGSELGDHQLDIGFQLPDVVWNLDDDERKRRAKFNSDVCVLDGQRHFIRGIALVPISNSGEQFGWGLWAEVSEVDFKRYLELFHADARAEPPVVGRLANTPRGYPSLDGQIVEIAYGDSSNRPTFTLQSTTHPLALEQIRGITASRVHEIMAPRDEWPFDQPKNAAAITTVNVLGGAPF
jgi:hypothetical protein